jgi:hypothetical protein
LWIENNSCFVNQIIGQGCPLAKRFITDIYKNFWKIDLGPGSKTPFDPGLERSVNLLYIRLQELKSVFPVLKLKSGIILWRGKNIDDPT